MSESNAVAEPKIVDPLARLKFLETFQILRAIAAGSLEAYKSEAISSPSCISSCIKCLRKAGYVAVSLNVDNLRKFDYEATPTGLEALAEVAKSLVV